MSSIIEASNLGKSYWIAHQAAGQGNGAGYVALRDVIADRAKRLFKPRDASLSREEFWALRDVSFDINAGDRVGIIGRNGSGKSTLLKILSRITEPTTGQIRLRGRVASLLEVGTGFHPELTGRENIYLNGAILGMSRTEIARKFDEIVEFAEVEKFLDTPVKRYSSGMYVRLAFAVAAHLEPEILVVDEVLAVGDATFQKKCLGKMREVGREGRTVLFVSHNMAAVKQLCDRGIWLKSGELQGIGPMQKIIDGYMARSEKLPTRINLLDSRNKDGRGEVTVESIELLNGVGGTFACAWDEPIRLRLKLRVNEPMRDVDVAVIARTLEGLPAFTVRSGYTNRLPEFSTVGEKEVDITIHHSLRAESFSLTLGLYSNSYYYYYSENVAELEVLDTGTHDYRYHDDGFVNVESHWQMADADIEIPTDLMQRLATPTVAPQLR